tara:strand:+ start:476 stop:733 length:258 start_codon:yes stop_codon:yes gene_type:complete
MNDKFSASDWKDSIEKDLIEIKKAIYDLYGFINMFEQWRRLPFNKETKDANQHSQDSSKRNTSKGNKRKSGKKLHRQARKQSQRA